MLIGILGAGQLGRMIALAGYPLGLRFRFFDPTPASPAAHLAEQVVGDYDDQAALMRFAQGLTLVTYEFENVPVATARFLQQLVPVYPPPAALEAAQDRLVEKRFFDRLGIATPSFAAVGSRPELDQALVQIGLPAVLKTRRMGYDGKGQAMLRTPDEAYAAWDALGSQPLILERLVSFSRELSILAARSIDGSTVCYPLVQNEHRDGILRRSVAPAPDVPAALQSQAESYATQTLDALGYVGILAIELFHGASDEAGGTSGEKPSQTAQLATHSSLLVNEMAPRVHNSGHWTIEGAATSQFENHLRALLGLPLGSTAVRGYAAMLNLIGSTPEPADVLCVPEAHLHLYGKLPRPGRKLGHITIRADDPQLLDERMAQLENVVESTSTKAGI